MTSPANPSLDGISPWLPSLAMILAAGIVLRLVWSLLVGVDPVSDGAAYDLFARNLAFHGVYGFTPDEPGAYWAVGAAAIYAGVYAVFGTGAPGVVAINLISSLIAIWGLWDLGRRWYDETTGRIAALLFALWPMSVQFTTVLASELHFIALTILALIAWDRAWRVTSMAFWLWTLAAGIAFAGATYVRPIALLIPAVLALGALLHRPQESLSPILKAAVTTAVIFACVAPWSARNERIFGEPVFMSTNFWANFWMGNHAGTDGEYVPLPDAVAGVSEIERAHIMRKIALEELREDPFAIVPRTLWKAVKLHKRETIGVGWNEAGLTAWVGPTGVTLAKAVSTGWWYAVLGAAFAGIVILARRSGLWTAILSAPVWLWGYFTGIHAVIVVGDRYHMPAIPFVALLAAIAVAKLTGRRRTQAVT